MAITDPITQGVIKPAFQRAAAEGAWLEMNVRILADKTKGINAYAPSLDAIERDIARVFAAQLSEADVETLRLSRQLRNKLLHGDLHEARSKLQGLGVPVKSGGVRKMRILPGESVLQSIQAGLANHDAIPVVSDMTSTEEAGLFGWLLELATSGALDDMAQVLRSANAIVDRLMLVELEAE